MKRLAALLLLLLATPAWGATYWVAPDSTLGGTGSPYRNGADSTAGVFPAGPKTLSWFNANAAAGDICRFKSGDYGATAIDPRERNTTSTSRIRYYGFPNDPGAVRVANVLIGEGAGRWGKYITVRWVTTTSAFTGIVGWYDGNLVPVGDSLVNCRSAVANSFQINGSSHVVDSLALTGTSTTGGNWCSINGAYNCDDPSTSGVTELCINRPILNIHYVANNNRITNSTFTVTRNSGTGDFKLFKFTAAESTLFYNNTVNFTLGTTVGGFMAMELYMCKYNQVQGNTWNFTMNATPAGTRAYWCLRDSSRFNRFVGNTFTASGAGQCLFMPTNSGSFQNAANTDNYYGYNTINVAGLYSTYAAFYWQNGIKRDTVEFNTIATSSTNRVLSVEPGTPSDRGVIRHNTLLTAGTTVVDLSGGTGNYVEGTRLAANVYYAQDSCYSGAEVVKVSVDTDVDSAGCFFSLSGDAAYALAYGGHAGTPGSGGNYGGSESKWGTPLLADSAYALASGLVKQGGYAVSTDYHDGYVGVGVSDADVTAPAVSITGPTDTTYAWTASETMPITWTASDAVGVTSIKVDYGSTPTPTAEPAEWLNITTLSGATVSYNWLMAGVSENYGMIRVRAFDAAGNLNSSTQVYRAVPTPEGQRETEMATP